MRAPEFSRVIVPLGRLTPDGGFAASGAGVLIAYGGFSWLVTALHVRLRASKVVRVREDEGLIALGIRSNGTRFTIELDRLLAKHGLGWVDSDEVTDLTAAPVALSNKWSLRCVTTDLMVRLHSVAPAMPCYTIGVPYAVPRHGREDDAVTPLVLNGIIAGVHSGTRDVFFTAPVFRGNHGSPLLVEVAVSSSPRAKATVGLVGVVLDELLIGGDDCAVGAEERGEFPTRLGRARSAEAIEELLSSDGGRSMLERVQQAARAGVERESRITQLRHRVRREGSSDDPSG